MEYRDYYKFKYIFDMSNDVGYNYLDIGFTYLGFIVKNRFHKGSNFKYFVDVEETIKLLLKGFNSLLEKNEIFKYIKLDYDVIYKDLEDMIKKSIEQYSDLMEWI